MKKWSFLLLLIPLMLTMCGRKKVVKIARDVSITSKNAVTRLAVDSLQMEDYISQAKLGDSAAQYLRNFYNSRNFQFAWITEKGLTEQARMFYMLNKDYASHFRDSTMLDPLLYQKMDFLMKQDTIFRKPDTSLVRLDLELTQHFFNYVRTAYEGKVDPEVLQWHIPRKKLNTAALLDSLMSGKKTAAEDWEPVNIEYKWMKKKLTSYYQLQQEGKFDDISNGKANVYRIGDSALTVQQVRLRLLQFGDSTLKDSSSVFDSTLLAAVKRAQGQYGMNQNGSIGKALIKALNVPLEQRIRQILINMERMRWMPEMPDGRYLLANIPEYRLHVFEDHRTVLNMGIVVGKAANKTVIFSNKMRNIVFSPYWNIPASIVRAEVLPAMKRNRNYLASKNMEQTGFSNGLPELRQKPGDNNSLGRVKFLFPNSYDIYFHDTPAKSLFAQEKRAFSHGCIRLSQPAALAEYLLNGKAGWTKEKIAKAMSAKKEVWVALSSPVPVFITYFTSWVDEDRLLNFRDDVYGHDRKMAEQLFEKS